MIGETGHPNGERHVNIGGLLKWKIVAGLSRELKRATAMLAAHAPSHHVVSRLITLAAGCTLGRDRQDYHRSDLTLYSSTGFQKREFRPFVVQALACQYGSQAKALHHNQAFPQ
jgi:hypothetical protein